MAYGYFGKILIVDLSHKTIREEKIPDEVYRQFYGGYGLGVHYIYKNIKVGCDPLGPDNILGFCPGLLTGSPVPLTGRYMICGKSPLTGSYIRSDGLKINGGWGNSNSGGTFGPALRRCGYDSIFFTGRSETPVYLLIDGDKKEILQATELWGRDLVETEKMLHKKYGKQFHIAAIGQAGENLSLIAGIANDSGRIAGRSGLGAVMGSKNLKALCLKGSAKLNFANKVEMMDHIKTYNAYFNANAKKGLITKMIPMLDKFAPAMRRSGAGMTMDNPIIIKMITQMFSTAKLGTTSANVLSSQIGDTPVKNFKGVGYKDFPHKKAMKLRGKTLLKYSSKPYGCYACPARCGAILKYDKLPYPEKETHRPEYETCAAFGALILNNDLDAILQINEYLNRAGMDSISAGATTAFVMECCEKGLLKKEDFKCKEHPEGFLPAWEDSSNIMALLKIMVTREGIGALLADGVKIASEKISGSSGYAMHVNGQEIPMHDPRNDPFLALTYVADPTPARHTAATLNFEMGTSGKYFLEGLDLFQAEDPYGKGLEQAKTAKFHQTIEAMGFCLFAVYYGKFPYLEIIKSAFNWEISVAELLQTGQRIQTMRQMFNAREGAIRHHMPKRAMGSPPQEIGPLKDKSLDLEYLIQAYYDGIGFDKSGVPKSDTLDDLGLNHLIPDLKQCSGAPEPFVNEYLVEKSARESIGGKNVKPLTGG